ncbi:hypothetical protein HEP81_00897 [Streptomyces griseofuscus]|uniref:DUF6777 domain-containing protein n=1 Tax=Streptomyces griseofuscus TaxID=146922 RepID=A0A7H1PT51_9ACTN|nr:DUF6777 domain-containing protein [Streptomyces griseofuscus]QNT91231.1 hypothetical protein HEP81_00897 [Streptomyces griseofuscus]
MRIPTGSMLMACVLLSVGLLLTGCAGASVKEAQLGEEVFLQPAAEQGPNPFTASMATGPARTGTPRPTGTGRTADVSAPPAGLAVAPLAAARALSGGTPGLYSGSVRVSGCDVERQIGGLTADPARRDAFAHVAGVSPADLPGYLRALTPVLLRADTRVTNHGYRDGQTAGYQAVLQAGTAVLVDNRGVPRVRCACGNPLRPPEEARGGVGARGTAWSGYRPNQVIVVTPAPQTVGSLTLLDAGTNTWIERRLGPDVRNDHLVAPPAVADTAPPDPGLTGFPHPSRPDTGRPSPRESRPNTATGEIGGAVIDTGRVTPGHGDGRGERADDRRTRADGIGAGERERSTRAVNRGAPGRSEGRSDTRTQSAKGRPDTGSDSTKGTTGTGANSGERTTDTAEGRSDTGSHSAASADGHGTHAADERVTPAPDARGTSGTTGDGTGTGTGTGTADRSRAPAATGDEARTPDASAPSDTAGHGTRTADPSGAPAATGDSTRSADASATPAVTGHGTRAADASGAPAVTGHGTRAADPSGAPAATGDSTRSADASATPAVTGHGTRAADASSAPAVTGQGTPTADARGTSAAPGRGTPAPVTSAEARAVLLASALPSASSAPSKSPAAPKPKPTPSTAPSLLDPLAYPPDTSLYNSAPFGDSLMPQDSDEIGPPNVTDTPAMPDPSGTDALGG